MTFEPLEPTTINLPGWIRKAAGIISRLQRGLTAETEARQAATGWGDYTDDGSVQAVAANTDTPLQNNRAAVIEDQKPADIATFYDGARLRVGAGDLLTLEVEFTFTPADGTATSLLVWLAVDGVRPLYRKMFSLTMGSGMAHPITHSFNAYGRGEFVANGGRIMIRTDGPGTVTARRYLIGRAHHGR